MRIQRLRTRIIIFFVALLALVQLAAFALVNAANTRNAHRKIEEELGHSLGMKVVAEGVEDLEGWNLLRQLGCDDAQGYYMSPPLPAADLVTWMHTHDAPARERATTGTETAHTSAQVFAQRT